MRPKKFETVCVNNYTPFPATSFPKYLSPRPFDKKTTLRKIRYAVFGSLAVQFSARKERGEEGREDVGANATTKNVLTLERERERDGGPIWIP